MFCIQPGCWECQASVWPRTCLPLLRAQLTIWSPALKLNWFWFGSVASSFISFSAVTMLNSRFAMVVYCESESLCPAIAVPKYRPDSEAAACNVLPAACAVVAATPPASTTAVRVASEMARNLRRGRGGVSFRVIVDPFVWDVPSLARRT